MPAPARPTVSLASLAVVPLVVSVVACGSADGEPGAALREGFPAQAASVLDREAFVMTPSGFARARSPEGSWSDMAVALPLRAADPVVLRAPGGMEARVFEEGITGDAVPAAGAVTYRRAGGTSFWTVAAGGIEEWLHLQRGVATRGAVVATWHVEGAALREAGDRVELLDHDGVARIFVTAPEAYALGGRPVEAHLSVRGGAIDLRVDADGEAVLVDPVWTLTGSLATARTFFAMVTLGSGKVLAAGGQSGASQTSSAEQFDPATNLWTTANKMTIGREWVSGVWVPALSKAMILGGQDSSVGYKTADLYDPATNGWSTAAPMNVARATQAAVLLNDGRVLVSGGGNQSAEIYDPAADAWTQTGAMTGSRTWHAMAVLPSGDVLVAGGINGATAEVLDLATSKWTAVPPMSAPRLWFTLTTLSTGQVLAAGGSAGFGGQALATAELFDPVTSTWAATASMGTARSQHTATLLPTGRVLVAGSNGAATSELYDPASAKWIPTAMLSTSRAGHGAALLPGGEVLVAAGTAGPTAEVYANTTGTPCTSAAECASGFCADGFCCDTACSAGVCDACSIAAGAPSDGTCALFTGSACDDGDACTQIDACQSGLCTGGSPVLCPPPDACHDPGKCDPSSGVCALPSKADGSPCDDGDGCTLADACQGGVCLAGAPVVCAALDVCHVVGTCAPATGLCDDPPKALDCTPPDPCVKDGACSLATGACAWVSKVDGEPCEGGQCIAGQCIPDPETGGATGGTGTNGAGGAAGTGTGAGAGVDASSGAGANGAGASGAGANGSGAAAGSDLAIQGGGCSTSGQPADAPWLVLAAAALAAGRRRARPRS